MSGFMMRFWNFIWKLQEAFYEYFEIENIKSFLIYTFNFLQSKKIFDH